MDEKESTGVASKVNIIIGIVASVCVFTLWLGGTNNLANANASDIASLCPQVVDNSKLVAVVHAEIKYIAESVKRIEAKIK